MDLRIKRLHSDAKLPDYCHPQDSGMSLYALQDYLVPSNILFPGQGVILVRTGIAIELPEMTEGQVRPRSGLALKHHLSVLNSPGTVDENYRGEVCVILENRGKEEFLVEQHMRIAQLVIAPVLRPQIVESSELTDSSRGEKGFGSTGTK